MKFETTLFQMGNNTGIEVPPEIVAALDGGKKPAVVVRIGKYSYRSTIAVMDGRNLISFSADRRAETGLKGGDTIVVELALDTAKREVVVPPALDAALAADPAARTFLKLCRTATSSSMLYRSVMQKLSKPEPSASKRQWNYCVPARSRGPFSGPLAFPSRLIANKLGILGNDHIPKAELCVEVFGSHAFDQVDIHLHTGILVLIKIGTTETLGEIHSLTFSRPGLISRKPR